MRYLLALLLTSGLLSANEPPVEPPVRLLPNVEIEKEPEARWPRNADDVELTLNVIEALEEGPLILEFCLKNVSKDHLKVNRSGLHHDIMCDWPERGIRWERVRLMGTLRGPSPTPVIAPNEQLRIVRPVQHTYLQIPVGKVAIQYRWEFNSADEDRPNTPLFTIRKKRTLTILPATALNLEATIKRYRQLPTDDHERVSYIRSCRHPEFAPLLAEIIAASARTDGVFADGYFNRSASRLVGEIYDSFPTVEEGFQFLKTHLRSATPFPNAIFNAWKQQHVEYEGNLQTFGDVHLDRVKVFYDRMRKQRPMKHGLLQWERPWRSEDIVGHATHIRHTDWRLTATQFKELLTIPNLAVRIELYIRYPEQCPPAWVQTLFADLANIGKPLTTFAELLKKFDHPRFAVREEVSAMMLEYAPAFAKELDAVDEGTLSEEALQRLTHVRANMKTHTAPPYWRETLLEMIRQPTPHALALTQAFKELEHPSYVRTAFAKEYKQNEEYRRQRR